MKQTAVEFLEKICNDRGYYLLSEYFEQAKAMEKEQHKKTKNILMPLSKCQGSLAGNGSRLGEVAEHKTSLELKMFKIKIKCQEKTKTAI